MPPGDSCNAVCTSTRGSVHVNGWWSVHSQGATQGSLAEVAAHLVQRRDGGRQAAVHAEDLVVDQG